ncbi:MAG TPA: PASTA domain-containing protein [Caldilineae bacterium]|nr:PASTA domain-containing protein [Caldilineae bacterium]
MANRRSELDRFRVVRYDPIMPEGWNALRAAILQLYDDVAALAERVPNSLFVIVRDAVTGDIMPATWIEAVSAAPMDHPEAPLPPGVRLGDYYLIANPEPGQYSVTVEPRPTTGYLEASAEVIIAEGTPATVEIALARAIDRREIPNLFGASFAAAQDRLMALDLTIGRVMEAHGHVLDPEDWPRFPDQPVISTEPGVGVVVPVGHAVDILLAAISFPLFPGLAGLSPEEAREAIRRFAEDHELTVEDVEITEEERVEGVGTVVAQEPTAGAEILSGTIRVRLVVAIPQRVEVPDLIGHPRREVATLLEAAGLTLDPTIEEQETATLTDHDRVARQSPAPGERVPPGTAIHIVVWRFPHVVVPELTGMTLEGATEALRAVGLELDPDVGERATDEAANDGRVAAQEPTAGTEVLRGSAVRIVIWRVPRVAVPNLIGMTREEAEAALTAAGLTLDPNVRERPTNTASDDGRVAAQRPTAGTEVSRGTSVRIVLWRFARVTVPNVVERTESAAREILVQAGLRVSVETRRVTDPTLANIVLEQDPAAGAEVAPNTIVTLVIAVVARMPELRCMPRQQAEERLREFVERFDLRWDERIRLRRHPSPRDPDTIIRQRPTQGTPIGEELRGVALTVRRPPFPDLRCLHIEEDQVEERLKRWADQNRVELTDLRIERSPSDRPPGTILAQKPAALSAAYSLEGIAVALVVAVERAEPLRGLPELLCLDRREAEEILQMFAEEFQLELRVAFKGVSSERPEGTVLGQSPAPGAEIPNGATVTLAVARPPLPDVICLGGDEAWEIIERATEGRILRWNEVSQPSPIPESTVIDQAPLPGAPLPEIEQEVRVRITISTGSRDIAETPEIPGLEAVSGIGPARAKRLRSAGIRDTAALARASVEEVAQALAVSESFARTLIERAWAILEGLGIA